MTLLDEFAWRGLVYDTTEGLGEIAAREPLTTYSGFDPTAASLHVGHLLPLLALSRAQRLGHPPIAVVGGGTGLIGDPSGKSAERTLLEREQVEANVAGIRAQIAHFLDTGSRVAPARIVDNAEWLTTMSAMAFLRDVGKYFSVNAMLARESVRRRLESEEGISYTEFSYSLLQAYDYLVLHDRHQCRLQIGGSDQWGNIVAGCDLIRRLRGVRTWGLVLPLLTTASGAKFGKTEAGAVWLDPALTRPYDFYQFWLNAEDRDAVRYLRFFTFLDEAAIRDIEASAMAAPEARHAQRALAREVTRLVHGDGAVREAEAAAAALFGGDFSALSADTLLQVFPSVSSASVPHDAGGWGVIELAVAAGLAGSRGEATRLIRGGGISVNGRRMADEKARLGPAEAIDGRLFVLRRGKKDYAIVRIQSPEA
jgi:tyrosyl-tRNA synthetase